VKPPRGKSGRSAERLRRPSRRASQPGSGIDNGRVSDEGPWRAVLDTNAVDAFVEAEAFDYLVAQRDRGSIDFMFTHIAIEELLAIADLGRRTLLTLHLVSYARLVPTGIFVLDYSRLGMARLGYGDEPFEAWRAEGMNNTRDGLVVSTARFEHCPVVTNDKRFRGRANRNGVEAITPAEALRRIGFVRAGSSPAPD